MYLYSSLGSGRKNFPTDNIVITDSASYFSSGLFANLKPGSHLEILAAIFTWAPDFVGRQGVSVR